jgi:hypothetical protein
MMPRVFSVVFHGLSAELVATIVNYHGTSPWHTKRSLFILAVTAHMTLHRTSRWYHFFIT